MSLLLQVEPDIANDVNDRLTTAHNAAVQAARLDEVARAAPHQVSHYFEIPQSELNASWYLDYCKYRHDELQGDTDADNNMHTPKWHVNSQEEYDQALREAIDTGGGEIHLAKGTYKHPETIPDNTSMRGDTNET